MCRTLLVVQLCSPAGAWQLVHILHVPLWHMHSAGMLLWNPVWDGFCLTIHNWHATSCPS